jgi:putative flippase GtrA
VSYAASIWWQHALHRMLVFGDGAPYWQSLLRMYLSYSVSLVLSAALNYGMVELVHLNRDVAWAAGILSTGLINYLVVKKFAMKEEEPNTSARVGSSLKKED